MGKFPESILWIILVITTLLDVASLVHSHQIQYPSVKRDESVVDDYHGTKVRDPYRWLEERDSEQVSEFVGAQNELTSTYLSDCKQRRKFNESLTELWAYPKYGLPEKRGSRYFYFAQQRGGEVLHVQENKESAPRVLINREQNRVLAFPSFGVSRNGELVVYQEIGDSENLRILNVSTGNVYPEVLHDVRNAQVAWDKDSRGFFYFSHRKNEKLSAEEDENPSPNIYYHRVGTKADSDVLAVAYADFENEPNFVDMETSVDGDFLFLRTRSYDETRRALKTNSTFYIVNLAKFQETEAVGVTERLQLVPVITKRSTAFLKYVTNVGTLFYFRSRIGNKNYKLIKIDLTNPSEENWRVVVDENINYVLQGATAVDKSKVVLSYTSDKLSSYAELRDLENGSLIRMFELDHSPYKLLSFSGHIDDSEVLFRSTKLEGLPELFYFDVRDPKGPIFLKVLFSMNTKGWGNYYETADIPAALGWVDYHHEKFVKMMILAKCDYVKNIPGIGIAKAQQVIDATNDFSIKSILKTVMRLYPKSVIPEDYAKDFEEAYLTYLYSAVIDPIKMESVRISTPPPTLTEENLRFAGRHHNKIDTTDIVLGNIYINTGLPSRIVTDTSNLDNIFPPESFFHSKYIAKKEVLEFDIEEILEGQCPEEDEEDEERPKEYPCPDCDKIFDCFSDLVRHSVVHSNAKPFSCQLCKRCFSFAGSLSCHMLIHEGLKKFKCQECGLSFSVKRILDMHNAVHIEARPFKCDQCEKSFKTYVTLYSHKFVHTNERPFICDECGSSFKFVKKLLTHISEVHLGIKPFKCGDCGNAFAQKTQLDQHITAIHKKENPYICDVCSKAFNDPSTLKDHKATHSEAKPYKCPVCPNSSYKTSNNLRRHIRFNHSDLYNQTKKRNKATKRPSTTTPAVALPKKKMALGKSSVINKLYKLSPQLAQRLVQQPTLSRYDPSTFVSQTVTYPNVEGESVEMILMHRKDLKRDGSAFTFITERDFTLDFYFGTYLSLLKDFNAVVAFPHLKEKGSGFRDSSLDDFIGAAKYLVEHGYSNGSRIIARGDQNTFGLFVASAVNKHPELFGAALPSLAAFDMLRFDVATNSTAGLTEDVEEFKRSYGISPLHNIHLSASQYPGIFVTTSNEYPIPLAYKYVAQLQYTLGHEVRQTNPFLMRVVPEPAEPTDPGFAKYHINREIEIRCFLEKTVGLEFI